MAPKRKNPTRKRKNNVAKTTAAEAARSRSSIKAEELAQIFIEASDQPTLLKVGALEGPSPTTKALKTEILAKKDMWHKITQKGSATFGKKHCRRGPYRGCRSTTTRLGSWLRIREGSGKRQ